MDGESWDTDAASTAQTTNAAPTDTNNNSTETKRSGFGGFQRGGDSDENKSSGFGSGFGERKAGFGGGRGASFRNNGNNEERTGFGGARREGGFGGSNENGEKRSFGFGSRNNEDGEKKEGGGFGSRFGSRRDNGDNKEGGFGQRREGSGFGRRDGSGFGSRRDNNDGEQKSGFGRRDNNNGGGFGGEKREGFGDRRPGGFGGRNNEDGEQKREGFGARNGFGARRENNDENGERKPGGFRREGGFGSRDNNENGEKRSFGFGKRNEENGSEGGSERKGFGFGSRNEDGEKREGGFGQRREGGGFGQRREGGGGGFGGERKEGGGFGRREGGFGGRRDNDENGEKREGGFGGERKGGFGRDRGDDQKEEVKREKYIPADEEDTEASLFHTISVGINFEKQSQIEVSVTGTGSEEIKPISSFDEASLSELLYQNVVKSQYKTPTPVQKYAIPIVLKNRDLMACAQTGSGKTAAYVLPIMTNILKDGIESSAFSQIQEPQALILSPTRELASQIFSECKKFSYGSIIKSGILYGGVDTGYQLSNLNKGCNILVATPGRLLDVLEKQKISLAKVKYFVLDEADRMLDMGFEKTVREILEKGAIQATGQRVTLMFSATFPSEIQKLAQDFLHDYLFLTVGVVGGANSDVEQTFHKVTRFEKRDKVIQIINEIGTDRVMIFIEHKKQADVLAFFLLQKGYPTTSIHGDRLQSQRESALKEFKAGKSNIIVCTSVAARGLDIEKVNHVINYDLPQTIDEYVHRIGRTGRCGNPGKAISFFDPECENDMKLTRSLARILAQAKQPVPEWLSELAEDSVGAAFSGKDCTNDMRKKFESVKLSNNSAETTAAAESKTAGKIEEEEW